MLEIITRRLLTIILCIGNFLFCYINIRLAPSIWFAAIFGILAAVSLYLVIDSWQTVIKYAKAKDNENELKDEVLRHLAIKDMVKIAEELGVSVNWLQDLIRKN